MAALRLLRRHRLEANDASCACVPRSACTMRCHNACDPSRRWCGSPAATPRAHEPKILTLHTASACMVDRS